MKKLLLVVAIVAVGFTANAQDGQFNVGVNASLPTGDIADFSSFAFNVEANYLFEVSDEFKVGPSVSYGMFILKEEAGDQDNPSFLPLAAAGRFNASEDFIIGADLGYALPISPENAEGGFYYRPLVGYNVADNVMIQASYAGISIDEEKSPISPSTFSLGAMFSF